MVDTKAEAGLYQSLRPRTQQRRSPQKPLDLTMTLSTPESSPVAQEVAVAPPAIRQPCRPISPASLPFSWQAYLQGTYLCEIQQGLQSHIHKKLWCWPSELVQRQIHRWPPSGPSLFRFMFFIRLCSGPCLVWGLRVLDLPPKKSLHIKSIFNVKCSYIHR